MTRLQSFFYKIFYFFVALPFEGAKPIFSQILDWLAAMYAEFTLIVMRRIETDFAPRLKPLIEKAESTGTVPPEVQPLLDEMKDPKAPIGALLGNAVGGGMAGGIVSSTIGPYLLLLQYEMQRLANQARWDPATGLAVVYRRPDKEELVNSDLRDQGWTAERIELLKDVARTRLVEDLCVELRRRGVYTEAQYLEAMHWLGYEAKEAQDYYKAKEAWPGISDLVRMAVREAFTPEIAEKFGQYQDLPAKYMEYAQKIGLPEDFAKAFWAAHWDLPSPQMGFDLLHRGIITQDELKLLLRALDIMPFWRDKLIQLSYSPFTRVDIRRMHKMGILTEAQVLQSYKDIGYNDEKAKALTDFTIKLNADTATGGDKELAKSEVISLYKKRLLTRDQAKARLGYLEYADEDIDLILDLAEWTADSSTKEVTVSQVKSLYQKGLASRDQAVQFLTALKYSAQAVNSMLTLWDWEKPQDSKLPSRTDLDQLVKDNIIGEDTWRSQMALLGYDAMYCDWYWSGLLADIMRQGAAPQADKVKDLTLAQLKDLYLLGLRTRSQITPFLSSMGFKAEAITALYELWDWEKPATTRLPSRTDYDNYLATGVIDIDQWSEGYSLLGYDMQFQEWQFAYLVTKGKVAE
jgi:hypothetical protein